MKHLQATFFLALSMATANAAAITYHVDRIIQSSTITGVIETNGDTGSDFDIAVDILSWSLALTVNDATTGDLVFTDTIDSTSGGTMLVGGNAVSADATRLMYDFTIEAGNFLLFRNSSLNFWCLETRNCSTGPDLSEQIGHIVSGNDQIFAFEDRTGQVVTFAAVIPVPAAIWLFGSGLLGLLGLARLRR